jgi:hypothetical protein
MPVTGSAGTLINVENWVIGSDKKPQFKIYEKSTNTAILLALFTGYGIVVWDPEDNEVGRFGHGLTGFTETQCTLVDTYTFEIALDKSLNTQIGVYKYRLFASWTDADFTDTNQETYNDSSVRLNLYNSVAL